MNVAVTCALGLVVVLIVCAYFLVRQNRIIKTLRKQNSEFITLCDLIQAPIWFKDKDLKLTWVNQFYALMYQIVLDAIEINIALNVLIRHFTDKIVMILAQIALVSVISVTSGCSRVNLIPPQRW